MIDGMLLPLMMIGPETDVNHPDSQYPRNELVRRIDFRGFHITDPYRRIDLSFNIVYFKPDGITKIPESVIPTNTYIMRISSRTPVYPSESGYTYAKDEDGNVLDLDEADFPEGTISEYAILAAALKLGPVNIKGMLVYALSDKYSMTEEEIFA